MKNELRNDVISEINAYYFLFVNFPISKIQNEKKNNNRWEIILEMTVQFYHFLKYPTLLK